MTRDELRKYAAECRQRGSELSALGSVPWNGEGERALWNMTPDALVAYCNQLEMFMYAIASHLWFSKPHMFGGQAVKFEAVGFDGDVLSCSRMAAQALLLMHSVHSAPIDPPPMPEWVSRLSPYDPRAKWARTYFSTDRAEMPDHNKQTTKGKTQ